MNPSRQSRNAPAAVAESARGTAARAHQNPGSRRRSCHSVGDGRPTARCLVLSRAQPGLWAARCRGASHWVVLWCDRRLDHGSTGKHGVDRVSSAVFSTHPGRAKITTRFSDNALGRKAETKKVEKMIEDPNDFETGDAKASECAKGPAPSFNRWHSPNRDRARHPRTGRSVIRRIGDYAEDVGDRGLLLQRSTRRELTCSSWEIEAPHTLADHGTNEPPPRSTKSRPGGGERNSLLYVAAPLRAPVRNQEIKLHVTIWKSQARLKIRRTALAGSEGPT
jgi:hypothetical protein